MDSETQPPGATTQSAAEQTCPLCAAALSGPTALCDQASDNDPIPFRRCAVCRALVPQPAESIGDEGANLLGEAGRSPAGVMNDAKAVAWELAEHLDPPATSREIIDLGAGRGEFLNAIQNLGYTIRGCEPSAFLCQMARASYLLGPTTLANTDADSYLADLEARSEPVAAVMLRQVLEGRFDPMSLLRRGLRLAPNGMIFIEWALPLAAETENRFHATPATLVHVGDELDLVIAAASVVPDAGLRVFYRTPDPSVVDLDSRRAHLIDLVQMEAAYRALNPSLAALFPEPGPESSADAIDAQVTTGR